MDLMIQSKLVKTFVKRTEIPKDFTLFAENDFFDFFLLKLFKFDLINIIAPVSNIESDID